MRNLDHIFLIHHNAVGFLHQFQQAGMRFAALFRMTVAQDVFPHHTAFGHARPDNGAGGHKSEVVVDFQLFQ
ncbi:hypothetical protein D3C86_1738610 [compost metagenome]